MPSPWDIPRRDELRRIALHLRDPRWHITRPQFSPDGLWHAQHGTTDLTGLTLGGLMDECEDHVLLQQAESGEMWERVFTPGEPDIAPLAAVLAMDELRGTDPRARLPRFARLQIPRVYERPGTLNRRRAS